jgi:Protein of unknown function (DUF4235)
VKLLYKPFGLALSMLGGMLAAAVFSRVWRAVTGQDTAPEATEEHRRWSEVLLAAMLQGAVFGVVKAAIDRGGAVGFRRATGTWPGKTDDDETD